ncbi:MAG: hypothetical protein A3F54_03295 [Candidatus Kerfeldbacteria bacterium RIFCSPHIGHO2_12_FULL_48_17]|uniref:Uncharacterized protein n=1 Tax=Candidatus Kerfeldbacteria bacterium RIFCSPHIGHO2_12_FULL_48_17 TaxID=1798542 RepID=A0A1G2B6K6_9BACT|nr:MAG: hypothetical protein A3F54_03295 [Candidatus Kerfeldbacteria bacterium RIFCSPHIGHO2_12_FULL_48_17]
MPYGHLFYYIEMMEGREGDRSACASGARKRRLAAKELRVGLRRGVGEQESRQPRHSILRPESVFTKLENGSNIKK